MELRGYDHYEVTLGDQIRGERASMGKSIADVERELHIKRDLLLAIENCDVAAVANPSLLPGYIRSYARYLGVDQEEFYRRFCEESGYVPPRSGRSGVVGGQGSGPIGKRLAGSPFDQSRFAVPPSQTRFEARISLGAIASSVALVALMGGLGYGGWAVLQNIQRVGLAPLPEAPEVVAVAPSISAPRTTDAAAPVGSVYDGGGALAEARGADAHLALMRRDGPISAIDPREYGVYAGSGTPLAPRVSEEAEDAAPGIDSADDAIRAARAESAAAERAELRMAARLAALTDELPAAEPATPAERGIAIQVTGRAWIRVRNGDRAVVKEGILEAGERYELPERVLRGTLRAGNAGDVYVVVDGTAYGPLGRPGAVVKNLSLAPEDVRREQTEAGRLETLTVGRDAPDAQRAEAD